jgi:hypothetical protein
MQINVNGSLPLACAHRVAEKVREMVEGLPKVGLDFVHVELSSPLAEDTCSGAGNEVK